MNAPREIGKRSGRGRSGGWEVDAPCDDPIAVGGKAFHLSRLKDRFPVPDFFVVTFAGLNPAVAPGLVAEVAAEASRRRFSEMAIRSSATVEDSELGSFAGMFESVLGVTPDGLEDAMRRVVASPRLPRVFSYGRARGVSTRSIRMSVVVQRQLRSRVSGVSLTRAAEANGNMIIEAIFGLGELLVSGHARPDRYVVDRASLLTSEEARGYQPQFSIPEEGRTVLRQLPFYRRVVRKLNKGELHAVVELSLEVERALGFEAADVEWAYEGDDLYVLQARPYTAIGSKGGVDR